MTLLKDITPVGLALTQRKAERASKLGALVQRIEERIAETVIDRGYDGITVDFEVWERPFLDEIAEAYDAAGWIVQRQREDTLFLKIPPPIQG